MANEHPFNKYLRSRKRILQKLTDIDRKLERLLHRLREDDPRIIEHDSDKPLKE